MLLSKENRTQEILFNIYLIVLFAVLLLPSLRFTMPYFLVVALFLGYYLFYLIYSVKSEEDNNEIIVMITFATILTSVYVFVTYFGDVDAALKEFILIARLFAPFFLLKYAVKTNKNCGIALIGYLVIICFIFISTVVALNSDPMIARLLAQGGNEESIAYYRRQNVGGFNFCYLFILFIPVSLYFSIRYSEQWIKAVAIVSLILELVFVFMTQYATLVVFSVVVLAVSAFVFTKNKVLRLIFAFLMVLVFLVYSNLFETLLGSLKGDLLLGKLEGIFDVVKGESSLDDITSRVGLQKEGFRLFLQSPIWGNTHIVNGVKMYELSSHSTVIELLSTTGVIGFVAYYGALVYMFVKILNFIQVKAKSLFTVCFLTIIVLSYFNPIHYFYEMQITLFFVLPILFRKKEEENEELAN